MKYILKESNKYIELVGLLKIMNLVGSGGEAKHLINKGKVKVNGKVETRKKAKIVRGDRVKVFDQVIFVD